MYYEKKYEQVLMECSELIVEEEQVFLINNQVSIGCGIVDILGINDENEIFIFELKRNIIDGNAVAQLLFYMLILKEAFPDEKFKGILIGNDIEKKAEKIISKINGIVFSTYRDVLNATNVTNKKQNGINENKKKELQALFDKYKVKETPSEYFARKAKENGRC